MTTTLLSDLMDGYAQLLAGAGIGVWADNYATTDVAIITGLVPTAPDNIIAITAYPISDDLNGNDSIVGVQLRLRGSSDLRSVADRSAAIFDVLEGIENIDLGPHVVVAWRQSSGPLGQDENDRWEWSDNYYNRVTWPSQYRPD